jgi:hypothetical protein
MASPGTRGLALHFAGLLWGSISRGNVDPRLVRVVHCGTEYMVGEASHVPEPLWMGIVVLFDSRTELFCSNGTTSVQPAWLLEGLKSLGAGLFYL